MENITEYQDTINKMKNNEIHLGMIKSEFRTNEMVNLGMNLANNSRLSQVPIELRSVEVCTWYVENERGVIFKDVPNDKLNDVVNNVYN